MGLPKYVSIKKNAQGREYCLYRKGRGTKNQWPTLRLPHYDDIVEFGTRLDQYSRLNYDGSAWKYTCSSKLVHNINPPNSDNIQKFWADLDRLDVQGKQSIAYAGKTFFALILQYKESNSYNKLASKTKYDYDRYLQYIMDAWGSDPVAALNTIEAQHAIDSMAETPAAATQFRAVLKTVVEWGIPRGFHNSNPVSHTEKPAGGAPYKPWPDWAFEIFFKEARKDMIWPVLSALFTGQRAIDVFAMNRILSSDHTILITAQKTKVFVPVPIHPHYKQLLPIFPSNLNIKLHLMENGKPWTIEGYRTAWQREMNRPEFVSFKENRIVFHGLRKNAVGSLAEAGATDSEISAVVGMSLQMVAHYSRDAKLKNIASNCYNRIKSEWENVMPNTLPQAANLMRLEAKPSKLEAKNK